MIYTKARALIQQFTPWLIWGLSVSACFTEFIIRIAPSSIVPLLMETFQASSLDISAFSAYFLYAYVLMQIPAGMLIDRFGPKICLSLSTLICAFSTLLFSGSDNLLVAQLARLLFGLGAAFAWLGTLQLAFLWFKSKMFSVLVGATQALGMLGAALGASLIGRLADGYGWQSSIQIFGLLLILIGLLIAYFVRAPYTQRSLAHANTQPFRGHKAMFKNPQLWLVAIFAGLLYTPMAVFAELWGSFYLMTTQEIPFTKANDGISMIFLGWAVGGPFAGILSNRLGRRTLMIRSAFFSLFFLTLILYLPPLSLPGLYLLLFLYGLSNCGMAAAYTAIAELTPKEASGVALGFGNGMSIIIGALCQQGVGLLIDCFRANGDNIGGRSSAFDLKMAMSVIVIAGGMALLASFFIKETLIKK